MVGVVCVSMMGEGDWKLIYKKLSQNSLKPKILPPASYPEIVRSSCRRVTLPNKTTLA